MRGAGLGDVHPVRPQVAAEPEVGHLHPPFARQQDVLGLDVAVDKPDLAGRADGLARPAA